MFSIEEAMQLAVEQAVRLERFIEAEDGKHKDNLTAFYSQPHEAKIAYRINATLQLANLNRNKPRQ